MNVPNVIEAYNVAAEQKSYNCQEGSSFPAADNYIYIRNYYSYRQEGAEMGAKKGHVVLEETRRKISVANRGHKCSEETKVKTSKALKGIKRSDEFCRKLSEANTGQISWNKGKKDVYSPETLIRMSEAHKGKLVSKETRDKISKTQKKTHGSPGSFKKGHVVSEKTRIKVSECGRRRRGEKRKPRTEEQKKHHSEKMKQLYSEGIIAPPWQGKTRPDLTGDKHPGWVGGSRVSNARSRAKRNELGFIPLNKWDAKMSAFVGHHLDRQHVMYIPEELHDSIRHRQNNQASMDRINEAAINWYVNYYGLI